MAKKLPENYLIVNEDGEVQELPFAEFVKKVVKEKKVKDAKDEDGNVLKDARDIVKELFLSHLNDEDGTFELPEEYESYASLSDKLSELVDAHKEAVASLKQQKEDEKEAKKQKREEEKAEKEKADREFQKNQDSFDALIVKEVTKRSAGSNKQFQDALDAIKLPSSIAFAKNGLGIIVSEGASKDDISVATAAVISGLEGVSNARASLQFAVGDMLNTAVYAGIFRSKGEATQAVSQLLKDRLDKKFDAGTINFYALMAERVTVDNRKKGIAPSTYLAASKIVAPRIKEWSDEDKAKADSEFSQVREDAIKKINKGELSSTKDVNDYINDWKIKKGYAKPKEKTVGELLHDYFFACLVKENIPHEGDEFVFAAEKGSPAQVTYSLKEITDKMVSSEASLQNILLKGYDVASLFKGYKEEKDKETKGTKKVPYLLVDPFGDKEPPKTSKEKKGEEEEE